MPLNPSMPIHTLRTGRARIWRLALGLLLGAALVVPAAAVPAAEPVVAGGGGSCTGWNSTSRPPQTIRVLRQSSGRVVEVDFRRYVEVVTAKEWPSYIPQAAIETGAAAVKQFGWVKTLAGNHRPYYVTSSGKCYDVVDGTRDQLYKPELANVTADIRRAVDSIWGLTLRKDGRFFETGYRTGTSSRCGRDANGRLLYARSVIDCARRGMSRQEIQFRYYGRDLTLHWSDGRVVSARGERTTGSKPAPTPAPAAEPTKAPEPTTAPARVPDPTPAPTAAPGGENPLSLPQLTDDPSADGPSSVMIWLPGTPEAGNDSLSDDPGVSMPTVYSLPGTLLLPSSSETTPADPWLAVCTTSVGALPVGFASILSLLPPPFGCANASVESAATGELPADGPEPVLARVYVNVERAWVIY